MSKLRVLQSNASDEAEPLNAAFNLPAPFDDLRFGQESSRSARNSSRDSFSSMSGSAREAVTAAAKVMYSIPPVTFDPDSANIQPDVLTQGPARVVYDPSLEFRSDYHQFHGAQIFVATSDPLDPDDLYLRRLPSEVAGRQRRLRVADLSVEGLDEIFLQFAGNVRGLFSISSNAPTVSEFAAMLRLEDSLKVLGKNILVRPAKVGFIQARVPTVKIWQCDRSAITEWAARDEKVRVSFKTALSVFIKEITENPQIQRGSNQIEKSFLNQVLLLQETFALVFFDRVLLGDTCDPEKAFDRALSDVNTQRAARKFKVAVTKLRESIEEKEIGPAQSLRDYATGIASIIAETVRAEAVANRVLSDASLTIDQNCSKAKPVGKARDKVKPIALRGRTLSIDEVTSIISDTSRVTTVPSHQDLVFVKPMQGASRFSDLALLARRNLGTVLLHLSAALEPFVEYEGVRFLQERTNDECCSALFQLERVRAQVLLVAASTDTLLTGKLDDAKAILAYRLCEMAAVIDKSGLVVKSSFFSTQVAAVTQGALTKNRDLKSFLPELRAVEEQALDELLLQHLGLVGITKPCFFQYKGKNLRFLPAAVADVMLESLLTSVAGKEEFESLPLKALVAWLAPQFSEVPELFSPAAQAIKAGVKFEDVFSEASRSQILQKSAELILVGKRIGLEILGERILSAEARRKLQTLAPFPSLNSRDDLKAKVTKILSLMQQQSKLVFVEQHTALQREGRGHPSWLY